MQETLDAYGAGVLINVVQLQAVSRRRKSGRPSST